MISLGKDELYDIIKENGKIEVNCQYCDKKYLYYKEDIDTLFSEN
jgi:molecular chaperone Hsp33